MVLVESLIKSPEDFTCYHPEHRAREGPACGWTQIPSSCRKCQSTASYHRWGAGTEFSQTLPSRLVFRGLTVLSRQVSKR